MRLFVPLTKTEFDALRDLARAERRRPQDQAAAMLAKVLASEQAAPQSSHDTPTDHASRRDPKEAAHVRA